MRADVRVAELGDEHVRDLRRLCDADPVVNVVVAARLYEVGSLQPRRFGGSVFGAFDADGRLTGAVFAGGNLIPVGGGPAQWQALADVVLRQPGTCSSLVGPTAAITAFWSVLERQWGLCRALRAVQPLLAIDAADVPDGGDSRVRVIEAGELDAYLPAAAALFTQELEVAPGRFGGDAAYRRCIDALIHSRRAFGIVDDLGQVVFKADVGFVSARACQVQGVWVRPDLRGRGVGTPAFAAVLRHAAQLAPIISLYVNDYNTAARRLYARVGMREVATFTTVLL